MITTREPKALAQQLRAALAARSIEVSHSDSLEIVARQLGYRDWNTFHASLNRKPLRLPKEWAKTGSRPLDYEMGVDDKLGAALIRYKYSVIGPMVDGEATGYGGLMQAVDAQGYRGKRLRFSAQLKTEDVGGAATLWMRVNGPRGQILAFDNMEARPTNGALQGTLEWQKRSIVLDIREEAIGLNFGFYLRGSGSVWTRSLNIDEVDMSVPLSNDVQFNRPKPLNLDFSS